MRMKFSSIAIKNFRNFENVSVNVSNTNVVFGLNDSGKTNFLTAIRTVLDYKYRNSISESDFFRLDTTREIEMELTLELEVDDEDSDLIISNMKGAISDDGQKNQVFIVLKSNWDSQNMIPQTEILWGNNKNNLENVPNVGLMLTKIDHIFDIVYLEASTDSSKGFSQYRKNLDVTVDSNGKEALSDITQKFNEINDILASTSLVTSAAEKLTEEYNKLRDEDVAVVIKSEQTMRGITNGMTPYISMGDEGTFPASGDGRQKFLSYAIQNALVEQRREKNFKITLFLIEEPENSLHTSLQKSLSRRLFASENKLYKYFFITTHSSDIVSEMDKTMLIRLSSNNIKSAFYKVDPEFSDLRKGYNAEIAEAIFYKKVMLVEGPSEKLLIDALAEKTERYPEENGAYIMPVYGVTFEKFYKLLTNLGVTTLIRTDNDVEPNEDGADFYKFPGVKRLAQLTDVGLENAEIWNNGTALAFDMGDLPSIKKSIWHTADRTELANKGLFLSQNDLENDMMIVAAPEIEQDLRNAQKEVKNVVRWLQGKKSLHMVEFTKVMSAQTAEKLLEGMAGFKEFFDDDN